MGVEQRADVRDSLLLLFRYRHLTDRLLVATGTHSLVTSKCQADQTLY